MFLCRLSLLAVLEMDRRQSIAVTRCDGSCADGQSNKLLLQRGKQELQAQNKELGKIRQLLGTLHLLKV